MEYASRIIFETDYTILNVLHFLLSSDYNFNLVTEFCPFRIW